jgi:DNA-binding Lrp family transcriptional regulator
MKYDLSKIDKSIIGLLQGDLPLESNPFHNLARSLDKSEQEILDRIQTLREEGIIRRWGAVLRHQQAGYNANAMVAWKVGADEADEAGRIMAEFKEISHCYLRQVASFEYNLFAMMHSRSHNELIELVGRVSERTGLKDYVLIKSLKEFKKASMKYV